MNDKECFGENCQISGAKNLIIRYTVFGIFWKYKRGSYEKTIKEAR